MAAKKPSGLPYMPLNPKNMKLSNLFSKTLPLSPLMGRVVLYALAAVLVFAGFHLYDNTVAEAAVREDHMNTALLTADSTVASLGAQLDLAKRVAAKHDTVYKVRYDTLRIAMTDYKKAKDSLVVTDTNSVHKFVATSDQAIRACSLVVQTCEQRVADRDTEIAVLTKQNGTLTDEVRLARAQAAAHVCSIGQKSQSFGTGAAVGAIAALLFHH